MIEITLMIVTFIVIAILAVLLLRLIVWLIKHVFGITKKEQLLRERESELLRTPNWSNFEGYLTWNIPSDFKEFYQTVVEKDDPSFNLDQEEFWFCPIPEASDIDEHPAIAWNGCGEPLYLVKGELGKGKLYVYRGMDGDVVVENISEIGKRIEC